MSRKVLIIRHAKSLGSRHDRHLYPKEGAPLSKEGFKDAEKLKAEFLKRGVDIKREPVAVSELIRTRQTAEAAGFTSLSEYEVLNEVNSGLGPTVLDQMIENKQVPKKAIEAAKKLLARPPKENIWVTHGMLIAALAEELGIPKNELFIPSMTSIIEVEI